jgi:hypothetical protein
MYRVVSTMEWNKFITSVYSLYFLDQCIPLINYSHSWSFCNHLNVILSETIHFKLLVHNVKKHQLLQQSFIFTQSTVEAVACRMSMLIEVFCDFPVLIKCQDGA